MENPTITILLVEDDPSMLDGIRDLLEMTPLKSDNTVYQASVLTAFDGLDGLEIMRSQSHAPDLIISDIMMPRMTGYEFLHEIQKNPSWMQIPFIFLTAKGEKGDYEVGRLSGANLYITKPFDSDTFIEQIKTQLQRSLKLKALQHQHIENLKKHILQVLNHEFRTPLTYVTAYYEMLADGVVNRQGQEVDYQGYLRGIQAGCIRLSGLVEDFLQVISLLSGETEIYLSNDSCPIADVEALVQGSVLQLQHKAEQSNVDIELKLSANLPTIWGSREHLSNAIKRILDNAIKFSASDTSRKKVYVSVRADEKNLLIAIKDYGIGLPEQIQKEIFELFFQYNRAIVEQQGAGTGLTIAQGIINLHKGQIDVESQENKGSTFTIVLPKYTQSIDHPTTFQSNSKKKATILAVEDDPNLLAGLEDLLETMDAHYELDILTASNGLEGLKILRKQLPDLIISDIMMPHMSGFEFLQEVRKNLDWLHIPVIFLTARGEPEDKNQAFISGVDEYITKPYDSDVLLKFVKVQLDRRFHLQSIIGHNFDVLKQSILTLVTPDFRQPLSFVSEYTGKLADNLEDVQTGVELQNSLQGIQIGSNWLKRVIEDLMSLAELKTGEANLAFSLQTQKIPNIGILLSEYAIIHEHKLASDGVKIHFTRMSPSISPINGDISTISDSIRRLIEVGVRYCSSEEKNRDVFLSVSQNDNDNNVNVFIQFPTPLPREIFSTVQDFLDSTSDAVVPKSIELGPNLSIAKGYIELHNGYITVENDVNEGCKFTIVLPVVSE
jgi:signal transduction histidine kinase